MNNKLPYAFDLLYDIKTMEEVESIARGEPHKSNVRPESLVTLFLELGLEVPSCLEGIPSYIEIWVKNDGTWQYFEPQDDEKFSFRQALIKSFKE
jgi:hypothetical protein